MARLLTARPATRSSGQSLGFSWPLIVALVSALAVFLLTRDRLLSDPDTYWHLAAGQWIFGHGAAPAADPFSHSMPGAPWTAHEWLAEVVMAGVHQTSGWAGLVALTAVAFAGTMAYLMRFLLARMEPVHALLFTAVAAIMVQPHLLARPHVLAWPLLAVWVGALVNSAEKGRAPPLWLAGVMLLWANLHGSFTLGLAFTAALAVEAVLAEPKEHRPALGKRWITFIALAVAAAMATPSGIHGLLFTLQVINMQVALSVIGEWQSPNFHKLQALELWLMLLLGLALTGRVRLPLIRLVLVLGLVHLSLKHQRYVSLLGLLSPLLMATPLAREWYKNRRAASNVQTLDRIFAAWTAPARPVALAVCGLAASLVLLLTAPRYAPAADKTPQAAVAAALQAGLKGPVLNDYNFGGYLIHRQIPVFVDGRADVYGDAFMQQMLNATTLKDRASLLTLVDQYKISWTLLRPGVPAVAVLDGLPGWRRVYADDIAVVHARNP